MTSRSLHPSVLGQKLALTSAVFALVAAPLSIASPASAAPEDEVTINLLNINDFHGRIDSDTVAFAGTVEQLRAEGGADNTLFLSAGDNFGASAFASAVADDKPTFDVLNALDLRASAVGNHEFDKGYGDLTTRVDDLADFSYLGANVYDDGTKNPALQEYTTYDVQGVTVGVIGAVTQETPSLVTPSGITDLDFGDPVEAVNRVAGELSDGDPANGEADVLVAEYHEGAAVGADGSTLEDEVAKGGPFADIVTETSAEVDVIFNGHSHSAYSWDGQIPGAPDSETRPVLQTGSYGENVGQVELTVDTSDSSITSYEARNLPRLAPEDTDGDGEISDAEQQAFDDGLAAEYPRVDTVQQIVEDALEEAAAVGDVPVGKITDSITTAYTDTNGDGELTRSDTRDDRSSESTLGDLVGDMLRDTLSSDRLGGAEIGITNPGGLRAELFHEGDTSDNPENTDGVVTFAEANNVLPFVNNLWTLTLTGKQFKTVLEQQWQPTGASDPYLHLGLSDNVTYTYQADAPRGEHITSVVIDGKPLDPDEEYRIGTFSFLATGGDNFTEFTNATNVEDSGLVDREGWIDYLKNNKPLSPDFARQAVQAEGLPETVDAGGTLSFTLSELDLTSLGSPDNESVHVALEAADGTKTALGSFGVTDGSAAIEASIPAGTEGAHTIVATANPSGTTVRVPVTVEQADEEKAESTIRAHATPGFEGWFRPGRACPGEVRRAADRHRAGARG